MRSAPFAFVKISGDDPSGSSPLPPRQPVVDSEEFGGRLEAEARELAASTGDQRYPFRELPTHPQAQSSANRPSTPQSSPVQPERPAMALTAEQFQQLLEQQRLDREEAKLQRQALQQQNNLLQQQLTAETQARADLLKAAQDQVDATKAQTNVMASTKSVAGDDKFFEDAIKGVPEFGCGYNDANVLKTFILFESGLADNVA